MKPNVLLKHDRLWLWCPGCDDAHAIVVEGDRSWTWNRNHVLPSISPSIRVEYVASAERKVCHSFVRDGVWEFLPDSTHRLAGRSVRMADVASHWPEWLS